MVDCGDTNSCSIPMWIQYAILVFGFLVLAVRCMARKDPYDRM